VARQDIISADTELAAKTILQQMHEYLFNTTFMKGREKGQYFLPNITDYIDIIQIVQRVYGNKILLMYITILSFAL